MREQLTYENPLVLADRGQLDLDAPVADYWPSFADERVLVRQLLSHTSGMSGWTERLSTEALLDLPLANEMLARQEPWFEPGSGSGYHMVSTGIWSMAWSVPPPESRSRRCSPSWSRGR